MTTFEDAARTKLELSADWKWVHVYQCTAKGKKDLSYESTGFSRVTLRHQKTRADVSVVVADSEWKNPEATP